YLYTVYILILFSFFFYCSADHRDLHSFPTRRSSDLTFLIAYPKQCPNVPSEILCPRNTWEDTHAYDIKANELANAFHKNFEKFRSEEHTSELQSRENLVCRLLLEKKKKTKNTKQ